MFKRMGIISFWSTASIVIIMLAYLALMPFSASAQGEPCYGEPECYGEPPPEPSENEPPSSEGSGAWSGYNDGRLNPDPGEYYTVYCAHDMLAIWGGAPSPIYLMSVPILDIFHLDDGASLVLADAMTLVRNTSDTISIYGSNGYLEPASGQKAFSLSECIARNGGLPSAPEQLPSAQPDHSQPDNSSNGDWISFCLQLDNVSDTVSCLAFSPELSGLQALFLWITQLCFGAGAVVIVPGSVAIRRKRKSKGR